MYFGVITENNFEKMKTLKNLTLLSCLVLGLSLLTFSCKKDKAVAKPDLYKGVFTVSGGATTYPIAFELHKDNTLVAFNLPYDLTIATGSGSYTITNNILEAQVSYDVEPGVSYLFTATFTGTAFTSGTWGTSPSFTDGGTWTMTKQ